MLTHGIAGRQIGDGAPMLLIHGVGMRGDYWQSVEEDLAREFALTVIDLPGHGASPGLKIDEPDLGSYSDCVADLLSTVHGATPTIVVGHSMGALIALDMAVRYPRQVKGIAVLNGVYRRGVDAQKAIDARVAQLNASTTQTSDSSATLERWFGKDPTGVDAIAADACREWLGQVDPKGYLNAYRAFANADAPTDKQLQHIKCPALFITGSLEPNSTPAMSTNMSQLVPDSQCVVVDDARHMMSMTHGAEVTQSLVDTFL